MAKILMIQTLVQPFAGTAYLNGAAKSAGHEFILYLGTDIKKILVKIKKEVPDIIGFSIMTGLHNKAIEISKEIKSHFEIPIIMGGPHATLFSEVIHEQCIDMICRGESEFVIIDLLNALEHNLPYHEINNLWVKFNGTIYKNCSLALFSILCRIKSLPY